MLDAAWGREGGGHISQIGYNSQENFDPLEAPVGIAGMAAIDIPGNLASASGPIPREFPTHPPGVTQVDLGYLCAKLTPRPGKSPDLGFFFPTLARSYHRGARLISRAQIRRIDKKKIPHLSRRKNQMGIYTASIINSDENACVSF